MFKKLTDGFSNTLAQAGEQAKARNMVGGIASPRTSSSRDRPVAKGPAEQVNYEEGNLNSDDETEDNKTVSSEPPSSESAAPEADAVLQKKLKKLAKYETKYPELLKAYRGLQASDAIVKSFEKVLAELTPAISVADIEAFQQWASNTQLKAQLTSDELQRVNAENTSLKREMSELASKHQIELTSLQKRILELERESQSTRKDEDQSEVQKLRLKIQEYEAERQRALDAESLQKTEIQSVKSELSKAVQSAERLQIEFDTERQRYKQEALQLRIQHAQSLRTANSTPQPSLPADDSKGTPPTAEKTSTAPNSLSKSQKKKLNKKKNAQRAQDDLENPQKETETIVPEPEVIATVENSSLHIDTLRAELDLLRTETAVYEAKIKTLIAARDSADEVRDMLRTVGQDLVEARDEIKALNVKNDTLNQQVRTLQEELDSRQQQVLLLQQQAPTLEAQEQLELLPKIQAQLTQNEVELKRITQELEIAEKTSSDRFKELSTAKDNNRLHISELQALKKTHQAICDGKAISEAGLKATEIRVRALERAEKDRKDELAAAQNKLVAREKELKAIQMAFKEEEIRRKSEENRASTLKQEVAKLTALRDSIISARSDTSAQLDTAREELEKTNSKLQQLQILRNTLIQERDAAQEELQMGKAKYDSASTLMESQREQTTDMQHRLRDTVDKHEAMQEELAECQRQLTERIRESETMRRLLSEIEGSQESRLREMRNRMETAIAERDKAEDEAAHDGKKRAREVEDLREKLTDVERALRKIKTERDDLQGEVSEQKKALDHAKTITEAHQKDFSELQTSLSNLSHSLHEAEAQITTLEAERQSLRAALKDTTTKLDRLQSDSVSKDDAINKLRNERALLIDQRQEYNPFSSPVTRHHHHGGPSTPVPSGALSPTYSLHSVDLNHRPKEKAEVDREYIKNVLLQFIEHKEKRKHLMPAISKLLLLNKQQEGIFVASLK